MNPVKTGEYELLIIGAVLVGGFFLLKKATGATAAAVSDAFAAPGKAADKIAQTITGDPTTSAGSALYDYSIYTGINPDAGKIATAPSPAPFKGGGGGMNAGTSQDFGNDPPIDTETDLTNPIFYYPPLY